MKTFGFLLIVSSFTFIGGALSRCGDVGCSQLKAMIELIRYLRRHIAHSRDPLWVMLDEFESGDKHMRMFFNVLRDKHNVDTTRERFEKAAAVLDDDAGEICIRLGRELGRRPLEDELRQLDELEAEAVLLLSKKTESLFKSKRIYNSVFPLVGLIVSILLL